jgi:hypothetical protein
VLLMLTELVVVVLNIEYYDYKLMVVDNEFDYMQAHVIEHY